MSKKDFLVWMASFLGTIFIGVEIGLGISVGLALLIVLAESAFPHTAELGRLPRSDVYRNVKQYTSAEFADGMVLVRLDAPIYFANVQVGCEGLPAGHAGWALCCHVWVVCCFVRLLKVFSCAWKAA